MKKTLWWASGADPEILKKLPTEQSKYASIGIAVILTGLVALITGIYSFQLIFNNVVTSTLIGLVWGMLIFNIERILIQNSFSRGKNVSQTLLKSIPVIIIVILLTIVISYPLILRIFSQEIDQQLIEQTQEVIFEIENNYEKKINDLDVKGNMLEQDLAAKDNKVHELRKAYYDEIAGKNGTGVVGSGPAAKFKERAYDRAMYEYEDHKDVVRKRQSEFRERIKQIEVQKDFNINRIQTQGAHSLIAKLTALSNLEKKNRTVFFVRSLVLLLMFLLNLLPFISKYLSKIDLYEMYLTDIQKQTLIINKSITNSNVKSNQKIAEGIEKLQNEVEVIKSTDGKSDIEEIKKLIAELKKSEKEQESKEVELNYENYFSDNIQSVIDSMHASTRKSGSLLSIGIVIILIGILVYLAMIFFWLDEFHTNSFQTYHIFGLVSTSLLFLFIEFLGAWFLRQHRRVAEETIYLMKFKAVIEKNFHAYLLIKENKAENKQELHKMLIELFKSEINFPNKQEEGYSSFAQEAMGTISNLTDSVKKLSQK